MRVMAALILDVFISLYLVVPVPSLGETFVSSAGPHLLHGWLCSFAGGPSIFGIVN